MRSHSTHTLESYYMDNIMIYDARAFTSRYWHTCYTVAYMPAIYSIYIYENVRLLDCWSTRPDVVVARVLYV